MSAITGIQTYCLTKDGCIGILRKVSTEGVTYLPLHNSFKGHIKRTTLEEIYFQDTNLALVKSKAKQLKREKLAQFSKFQNIVFDFHQLCFLKVSSLFHYSTMKKLSKILKLYNLSLVHLINLDAYVILDLNKSKNKNIEIKSTQYGISHIIGRRGSNISVIKENIGAKNISIKEISFEEFEPIKQELMTLLKELEIYLSSNTFQYSLIDNETLSELNKFLAYESNYFTGVENENNS